MPNENAPLNLVRESLQLPRVELREMRFVRIAALPHAMSKPTPTTEALLSYAATPPMGMT